MRVAFYSTHKFDRTEFESQNALFGFDIVYLDVRLGLHTAPLAEGAVAVCLFANDDGSGPVLRALANLGVKLILLRSAGFNHVDITEAARLNLTVLRVPAYSPHSVAEHTVALMLSLNRKIHRAYNRVREQNFSIDGLLGFDLHQKRVGIIGLGKIGRVVARILLGFGCQVLAYDIQPIEEAELKGIQYLSLEELIEKADIITLHCPLNPATYHLINSERIARMKHGIMIINTGRGALIDSNAAIQGLKSGKIGYLGLDVYEEEGDLFFRDLSDKIIDDDVFVRLMSFPNVLITAHQGFFTQEALSNIALTTLQNMQDYINGSLMPEHVVSSKMIAPVS